MSISSTKGTLEDKVQAEIPFIHHTSLLIASKIFQYFFTNIAFVFPIDKSKRTTCLPHRFH